MPNVTIQPTSSYSKALDSIEDCIFTSNDNNVSAVEKFLDEYVAEIPITQKLINHT